MRENQLFTVQIPGYDSAIRCLFHQGKYHAAGSDLIDLAKAHRLTDWIVLRASRKTLAYHMKISDHEVAVTPKEVGIDPRGFCGATCQFFPMENWHAFLTKSGVKVEVYDFIFGELGDAIAQSARALEKYDAPEGPSMADLLNELTILRREVGNLRSQQDRLNRQLLNETGALRQELYNLTRQIASPSADPAARPSDELRALASKAYARSKQLEREGK